jgi:hypothetical protein
LYIFCGIGIHDLNSPSSFECIYKCCSSDPNQIKNQLKRKLCTDDNILKALQIYLLNSA